MSPIRKENRGNYPVDWHALAAEIKAANAYMCQSCNLQCRKPGEPFDTHRRTLTIAHADSDYRSPEALLLCLCAKCHLQYDAQAHAAARRRTYRARRLQAGQLSLLRQHAPQASAADVAELDAYWATYDYLERLDATQ